MGDIETLIAPVRDRFAHVADCPFTGPRIFFENAGGSLTLKTVAERSAELAAIPDNQGRDNPASAALMAMIRDGKADARRLLNALSGQIFVGETGTELLFRLIRTACLGAEPDGCVISSTLEHPASRSAAAQWAAQTGRRHVLVAHDDATGTVTAEAYAAALTPDIRVATIVHTSPVTGIGVDIVAVAAAIRAVAPACYVIVDGIQHAAHGGIDIAEAQIDGYAISPYKVFSRHGYGLAWASDRLTALPHERLDGAPQTVWELGTRDAGAYATFSEVVRYFDWLGGALGALDGPGDVPRGRIEAAAAAIKAYERRLTQAMIGGLGNRPGLAALPGLRVIGGVDNPAREGVVSFAVDGKASAEIVAGLGTRGIRVHIRKADNYAGNILTPLGLSDAVRVSLAHYNTLDEVGAFLDGMREILGSDPA